MFYIDTRPGPVTIEALESGGACGPALLAEWQRCCPITDEIRGADPFVLLTTVHKLDSKENLGKYYFIFLKPSFKNLLKVFKEKIIIDK